jgi:hypothetical protein
MSQNYVLLTAEMAHSATQTKGVSLRIGHATSVAPIRSRKTTNSQGNCHRQLALFR